MSVHTPVSVFVAPDGNGFMRDIARWIVDAASGTGRTAQLVTDRLPRAGVGTNLVVAPHEFYLLRDDPDDEIRRAAQCSVPVCTEQPGTPWFLMSLGFCVGSPLVLDINDDAVAAIEAEGFNARRLALGAVPSIDRSGGERDIDVVFLGGFTERRAAALARLGPVLWDRHSDLRLFTFDRPVTGAEPGLVFGNDKYDLLARSRVLVNLHRDDSGRGYFEWARMVEAMANGCAVVTEASTGHEPLVAGRHFVETELDSLADDVTALLDDEPRRAQIARAAHRAVAEDQPLVASLGPILDDLDAGTAVADPRRRGSRRLARGRIQRSHAPPLLPVFSPHAEQRAEFHRQLVDEIVHRRGLSALRCQLEHGVPDHVSIETTPAHAAAVPEVSAVVTLHNYADLVGETLESLVASIGVDLEVVVVDDCSTDDSRAVARRFLAAHSEVPIVLVGSDANRGLAAARNLGVGHARADKVMMMDADNTVYPTCLRRLAEALDAHPEAAFAYNTLEAFGEHPGLRSALGWYLPWLCDQNYIDAQAMIRREVLERHGGYRDADMDLYGWEDWDLWLRLASAGERGHHVAEMLGRYRTSATSMVSITNLGAEATRRRIEALHPDLPWPGRDTTLDTTRDTTEVDT